ncbi:MAG: HAMP domain-containing protein [Acidobacteria bacterium]|nr:HAMP domain-containing protein [Acidobacteriota bacterium]
MHGDTLLRRLTIGFFMVAVAVAIGMWAASFWAMYALSDLNSQLVEITRSLDATRELSRELSRLLVFSKQLPDEPGATATVRQSLAAMHRKLAKCASSSCHGAGTQPKQMVESITPSFFKVAQNFNVLFGTGQVTPEQIAAWSSDSVLLIEETDEKIERMSSVLLTRVEELRKESQDVPARARRSFLLLLVAGVGLAWAVASFSTSRLLQPIGRLLVAIRSVGAGEIPQRVEVQGTDEIRQLADSFNQMVARLQRYRSELEEANRTLEQRVHDRTEELKHSHEVLYRSERLASIGLLTSGIAHEINNPLTSILMNINLLMEDEKAADRYSEELGKIVEDAERCKRIIDDLHEFSREKVFTKTETDVQDLLLRTLRLSDMMLAKRKIKVIHEQSEEGLTVRCDPGRIQQVFTNIILNAADAMPQGGTLRTRIKKKDGLALLQFTDSGCGIPAEYLSRVFDPFFTTKPRGTGLGLSLCYGIVAEHGGSLEIDSKTPELATDHGTTVTIFLPLAGRGENESVA